MTQAPATTVATAVRQHGGGRHPLNLPCTATAGRLQDSRGGVINRRAEGATTSHPLPASCAAAAHPTTGVRRARELSPSLRSQNRPHAQLVVGYLALPDINLDQINCCIGGLFHSAHTLPQRFPIFCRAIPKQNSLQEETHFTDVCCQPYVLFCYINRRKFSCGDSPQLALNNSYQPKNRLKSTLKTISQNRVNILINLVRYEIGMLCCLTKEGKQYLLPILFLTLLNPSLPIGNHDRSHYGRNRTNCLNPGGPDLSGIYTQHNYVGGRKDQDNTGHCDRQVLLCPLPAAFVPHPYHLDDLENQPSLPAPCHHVQRGAA